ncbi:MAG: hypothetical protein ACT4P9_08825 [Betaproteobacteria bacterium]
MMHVAVLASVHPSFSHARAGYVVLASLLEQMGLAGHRVSLYTACCANRPDAATLERLQAAGVRHAADFTSEARTEPRPGGLAGDLRTVRKALFPRADDDYPAFPQAVAERIHADGADAAILFWDAILEYLLPALGHLPVIGYLARPRTASPLAVADAQPGRGIQGLRMAVVRRILVNQEARHLARLRNLAAATNICALDAAYYSSNGVPCDYLSNTWPDLFGADWRARRDSAEAQRPLVSVLANIGAVNATGNSFGLAYLAGEVLPRLAPGLRERIEVNICGGGVLAPGLAARLEAQGVRGRGFVDDIDGEVLANRVFLLLNNAGPYTGGYTRVCYAFSAGACLVAHRRLADSMPEVKHGENALLGESGAVIAQLLRQVVEEPELARRLGEGARRTYEAVYRPGVVAKALVARARAAA